ncbi:3-hydroxy-3-methylglutaryl-coenzyme A reductase [Leptinotarsa decemlineata]|uniref:3-hydroxy-3-methylglutaryl-coenzyme A reductase n=1 Tax=Leptinotarsa decemlineata TaxID=7539 RepID=UPI003D3072FA
MSHLFQVYGKMCATHPWEVIVTIITLTTCFLTMDKPKYSISAKEVTPCSGCIEEHFIAADVIVMTVIRCLAILYSYHQFRNLQKLGSKYILAFAGLFVVFSSFVFTSAVLKILQIELVDLKDALFFFLLLIDLTKAAKLAQFALTSSHKGEITDNIAKGVSALGPTITLDTVVETLVIGVGTLSGVHRLEMLSYFACLSVIVNYVIFMTFYPACLSLMLELGRVSENYEEEQTKIRNMLLEEHEKSNPAVQRVKVIMSLGLMVVHILSRWSDSEANSVLHSKVVNCTEETTYGYLMKQFALSADHIVILILLITLIIKFVFFENRESLADNTVQQSNEALIQTNVCLDRRQRTYSTSVQVQTEGSVEPIFCVEETNSNSDLDSLRTLQDCLEIYRTDDANKLSDREIMMLVDTKHIPSYTLEKAVRNPIRGVKIRRKIIQNSIPFPDVFTSLPYENYDYSKVLGACCENVIGYVPVPVGVAGPLLLDDKKFYIPLATTEGCLVASTNRGCRAVEKGGIRSQVVGDGMTRGPVIRFPSIVKASEAMLWLKKDENFFIVKKSFDSTSRFAKLEKVTVHIAGRYLFIRFVARTGDAMGMNMISKGTEKALADLTDRFPDMEVLSLSGNICTDKKPAAINWIEGRGKSVVCESIISAGIVSSILKTSTQAMVDLNISKNMIGSAVAGSIGGFNAHAANLVTAIFIATGQDPAQNVASSNCLTIMEPWGEDGKDLYVSCTMPSIEIGTVGGGTVLPAQSACLKMLGVEGPNKDDPGANARQLARVVCGAVLAGEISLMAALASGHLVRSHLKYNRSYSSGTSLDSSQCDR